MPPVPASFRRSPFPSLAALLTFARPPEQRRAQRLGSRSRFMPESLFHAFPNPPAPALFLRLSRACRWGDDAAAPASERNRAPGRGCRGHGCHGRFPLTLVEENCVLPLSEVSCIPRMKHLDACCGDNRSITTMAGHSVLPWCTPVPSQSSQWFPPAGTGRDCSPSPKPGFF